VDRGVSFASESVLISRSEWAGGTQRIRGWAQGRMGLGSVAKRLWMRYLLIALAIVSASCATRPSVLGDPAIPPAGGASEDEGQLASLSYVDQARVAFPEAKRRFLEGLPEGYELRVAWDGLIVVEKIENGWITGHWHEGMARAASGTQEIYTFSEKDIIDWAIVRPNGVIEGNFGWSPLVTLFALEQRGTGKTCDLAKQEASSVSLSEAKKSCAALSARACRSEGVLFRACEWDETGQLYQVKGVRSYGCCA
jgi:hypothetical protein